MSNYPSNWKILISGFTAVLLIASAIWISVVALPNSSWDSVTPATIPSFTPKADTSDSVETGSSPSAESDGPSTAETVNSQNGAESTTKSSTITSASDTDKAASKSGNDSTTNNSSSATKPNSSEPKPTPEKSNSIKVTLTIDNHKAKAKGYPGAAILYSKTINIPPDTNAIKIMDLAGIPYSARQTGYGLYVEAINGLGEKQYGATSGWTYCVNGSMPRYTAAKYKLKNGDVIVWKYVTDYE